MKKHITLLTLFAMLLSFNVCATEETVKPAGNLVRDGEFLQEIDGEFWRYHGGGNQESNETTVMISPNEGMEGGSCLKLVGGVNCGAKIDVSIPEEDVSSENENTYIFSVYCKATKGGVQYFPYIKYLYYDTSWTYMGERNLVADATTVNVADQWIKITGTIRIPAEGQSFELYFRTADVENTTTDDYVLFDKVMVYRTDEYPVHERNLFTTEYGYGFEKRQDKGAEVPSGDEAAAPWQTDTDSKGNYVAHGGKTYLKIYNGAGGATKQYDFADTSLSNLQGQRFRLSFWLKSTTTDKGTANGVAAFKIFRKTSTGSKAGSTALPSSRINKVGDWYYMTPQKADTWEKFTIYFTFGGDGVAIPMSICVPKDVPGYTSVSVDDIVLTRVPETTMHGFGDLYDNDGAVSFSAGETVSAQTYYVPETAGATATMFTGLYEEKEGAVVLKDVQVKALSDQGLYESAFTVPQTGNYFVKSCIWNIGENTLSAMKDSILITQQAS